jgi:dihydroneopterin aldolase
MPEVPDLILIHALELSVRIGVPDEERLSPQRLTVNLSLQPKNGFEGLGDDLANAVDYSAVAKTVQALARERPRRLIETLACEIASAVLDGFAVDFIEVELHKYILPDTAFVAVRIARSRSDREGQSSQ